MIPVRPFRIAIAAADDGWRARVELELERSRMKFECRTWASPAVVRSQLARRHDVDLVILDARWWRDGDDVLRGPFVITASRPFPPDLLLADANDLPGSVALQATVLLRERLALDSHATRDDGVVPDVLALCSHSSSMRSVRRRFRYAVASDVGVLLTGERGTGKREIARAIHDGGRRGAGRYLEYDCARHDGLASAADLLAGARDGTVVLRAVDRLPLDLQRQLAAELEERSASGAPSQRCARVVAWSEDDPLTLLREGRLLPELYRRLRGVGLELPPLRARMDDIVLLAEGLLRRLSERRGVSVPPLPDDRRADLHRRSWPGNLSELEGELGEWLEGFLARSLPVPTVGHRSAPRTDSRRFPLRSEPVDTEGPRLVGPSARPCDCRHHPRVERGASGLVGTKGPRADAVGLFRLVVARHVPGAHGRCLPCDASALLDDPPALRRLVRHHRDAVAGLLRGRLEQARKLPFDSVKAAEYASLRRIDQDDWVVQRLAWDIVSASSCAAGFRPAIGDARSREAIDGIVESCRRGATVIVRHDRHFASNAYDLCQRLQVRRDGILDRCEQTWWAARLVMAMIHSAPERARHALFEALERPRHSHDGERPPDEDWS